MLEFDQAELAGKLATISNRIRPLFAAMVAERLFPHAIEFFGKHDPGTLDHLRMALEQVWRYGSDGIVNHNEREAALKMCMTAVQTASNVATGGNVYALTGVQRKEAEKQNVKALRLRDFKDHETITDVAFFGENAAAAIAYGLEAMATDDPNMSAWAGQRAYDTVDRFVMMEERELGVEWSEAKILVHHVIQQELRRQLNDIQTLQMLSNQAEGADSIVKLRNQAKLQSQSIFLRAT